MFVYENIFVHTLKYLNNISKPGMGINKKNAPTGVLCNIFQYIPWSSAVSVSCQPAVYLSCQHAQCELSTYICCGGCHQSLCNESETSRWVSEAKSEVMVRAAAVSKGFLFFFLILSNSTSTWLNSRKTWGFPLIIYQFESVIFRILKPNISRYNVSL